MMSNERHLSMLFSRLRWPSTLARERACTAIARLLINPAHAPVVKDYFLRWLKAQHHESVCGLALLALLRAKTDGGNACSIPASEVRGSLPWPSLQSSLLLAEYEPEAVVQDALGTWHSGDPTTSFTPRPFFGEYVRNFLSPSYVTCALEIEQRMLVPFRRQWEFEWETVLQRRPLELSVSPLRYWFGHQEADEHCIAVDTPLSEVYRSAYLRALAWAVDTRGMDREAATSRAAETVPVDLELWPLRPGARPAWWPAATVSEAALETAPGEIWPAVDELWRRQQSGEPDWGPDWVLARADGRVRGGETPYDLSMVACFQRPLGRGNPNIGEVFDWCDDEEETLLSPLASSKLRFSGTVRPVWDMATNLGGWCVAPAAGRFSQSVRVSRWQWWRWCRGMWGPAASLTRDGFTFRRCGDSLVFESGGEVIGRWSDWTEELRERLFPNILPATGQVLLIRREVIERFEARSQARLCWLARLTAFCRQHHYDLYSPFHDYRVYGASRILLPG
jgi:hypothetical protein